MHALHYRAGTLASLPYKHSRTCLPNPVESLPNINNLGAGIHMHIHMHTYMNTHVHTHTHTSTHTYVYQLLGQNNYNFIYKLAKSQHVSGLKFKPVSVYINIE